MPGSADLNPDVLVDSLVEMIDGLRDDLHPAFGVRPYRVFVVRRSYEGEAIGDGAYQDRETELRPQPRVLNLGHYDLAPGGLNERGETKVTEVSLSYAYAELTGEGMALGPSEQWLIRIDEGNGQGNPPRYFTHGSPPYVDREKDMAWVLYLRPIDVPGCAEP